MYPHAALLSNRGVILWMLLLCALATLAWPASAVADEPVGFDIPAQPLADALKHYATLTRRPTLFRSELVDGRTSSAVQGPHSAEAALRLLLDGTGLVAEKLDAAPTGAFILKEAGGAQFDAPGTGLEKVAVDAAYPGLVQAAVWEALCGDARTAPGAYRSLLRFQVDAAGRIQRARLLGSTGDASRDAAVLDTLRRVRMNRSPPSGMPQPVTLLILPRDPGAGQHCGNAEAAASF